MQWEQTCSATVYNWTFMFLFPQILREPELLQKLGKMLETVRDRVLEMYDKLLAGRGVCVWLQI